MNSKSMVFTSFSRAKYSEAFCFRPDNEDQLRNALSSNTHPHLLVRGSGLSYSDACLNQGGLIIDSSRLNHFISFDATTGIAVCQAGVLIKDLLTLHPEFIPPILPGTLHATLAGALAHDVHGKNNPSMGCFGDHLLWFELLVRNQGFKCSPNEHSDLFYATLAGLGLTGIVTKIALQLKKASPYVRVENKKFHSVSELTKAMIQQGLHYDYQAAWMDLLHKPTPSILTMATHCDKAPYQPPPPVHTIKAPPFSLITSWNMKWFNRLYFHTKPEKQQVSLEVFNNPLDTIKGWNTLYGPKGLIQFQALFDIDKADEVIQFLLLLIQQHQATPTLSVLKLIKKPGKGLLSFCKPGFTLAIDFINNSNAQKAIKAMNHYIVESKGHIYLAKDLLLTPEQFQTMYTNHERFIQILKHYDSPMHSDLAHRLRITP